MADNPHLSVVQVEKLHKGQTPHISSLIDRLDNAIQDYADEIRARGGAVTFAEIVGSLEFLKHDYLTGNR